MSLNLKDVFMNRTGKATYENSSPELKSGNKSKHYQIQLNQQQCFDQFLQTDSDIMLFFPIGSVEKKYDMRFLRQDLCR